MDKQASKPSDSRSLAFGNWPSASDPIQDIRRAMECSAVKRHLKILTNSSVCDYLSCQEFYHLRIITGIVPLTTRDPFAFGSGAHDWIEKWSLNQPQEFPTLDDPFESARLRAMLVGYNIRWADWQTEHVTAVNPEREFAVPLVNPDTGAKSTFWEVRGKLDDIVCVDSEWKVKEIKTSRDTGSGYFERLRIDSQISTYLMASKSLGLPEPDGVLYDVLKKPQLKPLKRSESYALNKDGSKPKNKREFDETPDEYFSRCLDEIAQHPEEYYQHYEVVRLESEVLKAARNLWFTGAMIRESIRQDRWVQNTKNCRDWITGKFCDYWPICSGVSSPDDASRYMRKSPFQELPGYQTELTTDATEPEPEPEEDPFFS